FTIPEDWRYRNVLLEFDGVSYQADVWLNGKALGTIRGLWRRRKFDVTQYLKYGAENLLAIRLTDRRVPWTYPPSTIDAPTPDSELLPTLFNGEAGGLQLIPIGIWGAVRLRTIGPCILRNLQVRTLMATRHEARLKVIVALRNLLSNRTLQVAVRGTLGGDGFLWTLPLHTQRIELAPNEMKRLSWDVRIANPRLWWTHDTGMPGVYRALIEVALEDGIICDRASATFGIRTVRFIPARSIARLRDGIVQLNQAKPVWLKGTCWVVPDQLLRLTEERYEALLKRLISLGFNTLCLRSTTLPETDAFYKLCDRYGIFVIQELPISALNLQRVDGDELLNAVRELVLRLRNHPCLLLWSIGVTEQQERDAPELVERLRKLLAALDPDRPFVMRLPDNGFVEVQPRYVDAISITNQWAPLALYFAKLPAVKFEEYAPSKIVNAPVDSSTSTLPSRALNNSASAIVREWLKVRRAIERAWAVANGGGIIIGQFNEPRANTGYSLACWTSTAFPSAYVLGRLMRAGHIVLPVQADAHALSDNLLVRCNPWYNATRDNLQMVMQVALYDVNGASTARIISLPTLDAGEQRIIQLKDDSLSGCPMGQLTALTASLYAPGGKLPSFVGTWMDSDRWAGILLTAITPSVQAKQVPMRACHVLWLSIHPLDANRIARALRMWNIKAQVIAWTEAMRDMDGFMSQLKQADVLVLDGDIVQLASQKTLDKSIAEQITTMVWRGLGVMFNGIPILSPTDAPLAGHLASLLPLSARAKLSNGLSESNVELSEPNHPALMGFSVHELRVRKREVAMVLRTDALVLLKCTDGQPLLIESTYGRGRILTWCVRIDDESSPISNTVTGIGMLAALLHYV
ncbi:MAG TPA: hypothetical protein EYP10_02950, partial [Armatimonadetes bacterium]|nr:hypothetical protein [Armatimonadota bacterium]